MILYLNAFDNFIPLNYSRNKMKKKVLIIISIVVGLILIAGGIFAYLNFRPPTAEEVSRYEQLLSDGDLLFEAREFSEAISKYNEAVKVIHTDSRAYSKIVDIYILKNDLETALEVAQKAQNRTTSAQASSIYADIAKAYFENKDYYNSRMNYEIAASLNSNPEVNLGLSKAYIYDKEFDLAKKLLEKEYDNDTVDQAKLLYAYILGSENIDEAKNFLNEYTVVNSELNSYFEEYSSVLNSLNENQLFNTTKLARIYINSNYPTLAIKVLEPKKEEITQYVDALYFLGKAYLDTKQYDQAVETLLQSTSLLGYESNKYWMLARAYFYKNDLVNAMTYYDMAVGYAGDDITKDLVEEYLKVLIESNQVNKAQEVYSNIATEIKSEWLYLIGLELYYNTNVDAKFNYYLDELASMEMNDDQKQEYLFWKIRKRIDDSDTNNLEQDFDKLLALNRFNPKYYWMMGEYKLAMSDTQAAKNNFELALEYDLEGNVTKEVEGLLARVE
jgi:tetratricopeptide (TPR) repeat protein